METVYGDQEIMPGISVLFTPGHTPGGQSVEIAASRGKAIVTGFCCTLANFTPTEEMKVRRREVAPPGLHQYCRDGYESLLRVKQRADIIVPLHEPKFINEAVIPSYLSLPRHETRSRHLRVTILKKEV
jgi:glyoxylase-like metal-dependent hydrolase (beta-lactamase superfamily II)